MNSFRLAQSEPFGLGITAAENIPTYVRKAPELSLVMQLLVMLPTIIATLSLIGLVVLWCVAFIQIFTRKDLQESKILWILLLLFVAPIGMIAYFFTEKKKGLGIWSIISLALIVLALPLYAIMTFIALNR